MLYVSVRICNSIYAKIGANRLVLLEPDWNPSTDEQVDENIISTWHSVYDIVISF